MSKIYAVVVYLDKLQSCHGESEMVAFGGSTSVSRWALHLAISVSVATSPRRARSMRASLRIAFSVLRLSASWDRSAFSALMTRPKIVPAVIYQHREHLQARVAGRQDGHPETRNPLNARGCLLREGSRHRYSESIVRKPPMTCSDRNKGQE